MRRYLFPLFCLLSLLVIRCGEMNTGEKIKYLKSHGLDLLTDLQDADMRAILDSNEFTIVTFVDGRCNVCLDALRSWYQLSQDSLICRYKTPILYYIGADSKKSVQIWTRMYKVKNYIIDKHKDFLETNDIGLHESEFHAFLLNKKKEVVLVGSPVNNPKMWELYKSTIRQLVAGD